MKKLFFGITLFLGGLFGFLSFLIISILHPTVYNGIDDLKGFLLANELTFIYSAFKYFIIIGLGIMLYEAYVSDYFKST